MVDWTMSVNPHWFSTMWGPLYMVGQGLSAMSFAIVILIMLSQTAPLNRVITSAHLHDLGKLLFAFLMLWAYLTFSQFLIIWAANVVEEIPHYLIRWDQRLPIRQRVHDRAALRAAVRAAAVARHQAGLAPASAIATWILVARVVDYYWHVAPEFHDAGLSVGLLDFALPIAIGGIFLALFAVNLRGRSLLPLNDPGLAKALTHHVH